MPPPPPPSFCVCVCALIFQETFFINAVFEKEPELLTEVVELLTCERADIPLFLKVAGFRLIQSFAQVGHQSTAAEAKQASNTLVASCP